MSYINEGFMVVWHDDREAENARQTIELRFKARVIEALQAAGMTDAARLVMQLPTSGKKEL